MKGRGKSPAKVALKRDETWWLHPAFRGQQALSLETGTGAPPHRWVRSDAPPVRVDTVIEDESQYCSLAKVLYRLNGSRPGPVRAFYVIVAVEPGRYAVGQLCADPKFPVQLFEDLVYSTEGEAHATADSLRVAAQRARLI